MNSIVKQFRGDYAFLSNFYNSPFVLDVMFSNGLKKNICFMTSEHYYQANKACYMSDYLNIADSDTPGLSKRRGQRVKLINNWNDIKEKVMMRALYHKFTQNTELVDRLVGTDPCILQEGNTWGDKYWGIDLRTGDGKNRLGCLLMELRAKIIENGGIQNIMNIINCEISLAK